MNIHPTSQRTSVNRKPVRNLTSAMLFALLILCMTTITFAGDINSNGVGGGQWNDTATWRGGVIPNSLDDVTITRGDVIVFDRNDHDRISCNKLFIDPSGSLTFKTGSGKIMMVVADAIESYGSIKMDAARTHGDVIELRMIGQDQTKRTLTLMRGGSITVAGRRFLNENEATAIISAHPGKEGFTQISSAMVIATEGHTALDFHNARLDGVSIQAANIDNTNAFAGQRLNIIGNYFRGMGSIILSGCDTPVITDNTFINTHTSYIDMVSISISTTPLPTVRNNTIKAPVHRAIVGTSLTDPLIQKNHIENARLGIHLQFSVNVMVQENTLINCATGFYLRARSGVIRDNVMDHCELPIQVIFNNLQFINNRIINPIKDKPYLAMRTSKTILFNSQIQPENVVKSAAHRNEVVIAHQPLVVRVKGNIPAGSVVEVVPVNEHMAHELTYPPVVNSPATLDEQGLTPTMITARALMVRSWQMFEGESNKAGEADDSAEAGDQSNTQATNSTKVDLPTYHLRVLGPASNAEKPERKVLASKIIQPDASWYRADLSDPAPMVEITLP